MCTYVRTYAHDASAPRAAAVRTYSRLFIPTYNLTYADVHIRTYSYTFEARTYAHDASAPRAAADDRARRTAPPDDEGHWRHTQKNEAHTYTDTHIHIRTDVS
jgi:hypothetical protein